MPVPLFDTRTPLAALMPRLTAKAVEVLERGSYILGPEVEAFEREFADHLGARHAIGVGNGTDALTIALRALGVGPGDEVVVPSFTFYASAEAVPPTGARPVFCDVDPDTACVTAETVAAALTPRTKAVIVVDLFGNLAPSEEIAALGVPVIEDAAQAAGSQTADGRRAGALGAALATFSFFPSKNLPAFGDGGAVVTDDDALADAVRMLRFHGSRDKVSFEEIGFNSRLDELQAALLRLELPAPRRLVGGPPRRRRAVRGERARGARRTPAGRRRLPARMASLRRLPPARGRARRGAQGRRHRPQGLLPGAHPPPAGDARVRRRVQLPATDELARTHLAIPMSPVLTEAQAAEVVAAVRDARLG